MSDYVIECHNLETPYVGSLNRPILNDINCQIKQSEFVVLLGLNGAGKSTLLRSLVGLVPLVRGEVRINGVAINTRILPHIRRDVGMLFQGGGLIPQLSAIENVLCGKLGTKTAWQTLLGFPKRDRFLALELLKQLGLKDLAYQKTSKLSGGQQQRVAIARALIQSPKVLLADEPTSGLDVIAAQQVMEALAELHTQHGMTIVTVLHDLGIAAKYAQRAIILDAGCIVYEGPCDNLQAQFLVNGH
ncbi:phosphonate ABC transporter ATP-binding protein [Umezakia ovalisporum]|uniref:Phosphonate ABC transporter ATP-binding protein n=1 Tax=Umezakia ovalisporum FSS-62 TaxID=2971776 RepID=A0AA43H176_9CYAN|nr:phosphonate ABC transporter ATP-binding protein [Umezakia ovalisporum]MDH6065042.1 phosphonate ABC transporter ATP-binding protein [Umezakia ovalisporum FSS-62]MDH6076582.1 phosphonate ABC transporter ATP-binding protein [Umezakia ovalisporum FSS-45]MDH6084655.1 phosphonate ABC transporter ATP-binding protein [Umezakia ovalisporum TAC611]MDH6087330.1 phosphonate ABC transporter ATP-binding protein [Umezakia ovalisporum Ak1311]CEJ46549.1 Phosphonates import ATP-binding protein PhnC [Umezakia